MSITHHCPPQGPIAGSVDANLGGILMMCGSKSGLPRIGSLSGGDSMIAQFDCTPKRKTMSPH